MGESITDLDINRLTTSESNPRLVLGDLTEMVASIQRKGIEEPLIVRKNKDKWEIIIGERRYRAAQRAGLKTLPCIVRDYTDADASEVSLVENIHRKDLTPLEQASAIKIHLKNYPDRCPTQSAVADKLGISEARVSQLLELLSYPSPLKEAVKKERITAEHARILASKVKPLKPANIEKWIKRIEKEKMSTGELSKLKSLKPHRQIPETWSHERMYIQAEPFPSFFVGCKYNCKYCTPTFQRQAKRQKQRCKKCYRYEPHFHPNRVKLSPPKTEGKKGFLFLNDFGDVSFASCAEMCATIGYCFVYPDRRFWLQSKNPACFLKYRFPENMYLATTIETNRDELARRYSNAPLPSKRIEAMVKLEHPNKAITIEPILKFDLEPFVKWIKDVSPKIVYIGYDSHPKENKLDEPSEAETKELMSEIGKLGVEVRPKRIRPAWDESISKKG